MMNKKILAIIGLLFISIILIGWQSNIYKRDNTWSEDIIKPILSQDRETKDP